MGYELHGCTIIARNYLPHAKVLADSFFAHHPCALLHVLLIDDERRGWEPHGPFADNRFKWWRLSDLDLDNREIGRLTGIYDVTELATAVKPLFLRRLLDSTDAVTYFDPDIQIFGSVISDVTSLARQHGIVITPHITSPYPDDNCRVDAYFILAAGVYNLGFIAVGAQARPFLDWWWNATRRHALVDISRMMFTDQRWIDFVPGFFDHHLLKDEAYNVAYWNLHSRRVTLEDGRYFVNGAPLRFFHFSGFDTKKPYLLSRHQGDSPRILLSEHPALLRLCADYADALTRAQAGELDVPYGWDVLPCGIPVDKRMRRLYRRAVIASEETLVDDPPSPFDGDGRRFMRWLTAPDPDGPPTVSRYLWSLYLDRGDLQAEFPDLAHGSHERFAAWARTFGVADGIHRELLPPLQPTANSGYVGRNLAEGVQIAGYLSAELGVGEAGRLIVSAVEFAGIPFSTVCYDDTVSRRQHTFLSRNHGEYDVNIVCVNADRIGQFVRRAGRKFCEGRYAVGFWNWELEHFPASMHPGFDDVDEVWAPTDFARDSIRGANRRPVFTVPLPLLSPPYPDTIGRHTLGVPGGFVFLFMFDFLSIVERKNPLAVIQAFMLAFRNGQGPRLILKSINGSRRLNDLERVRVAAAGRDDITVIDGYYSFHEKNALLGACDCYVSLHRSEGLGLTMAEAMALGKPVIATGYSGNLHFMTPENSYLVDYSLGTVPRGCDPYPEGSAWAEPNVGHAAELMRQVSERSADVEAKAQLGRAEVFRHNLEASAKVIAARVKAIREMRAPLSSVTN